MLQLPNNLPGGGADRKAREDVFFGHPFRGAFAEGVGAGCPIQNVHISNIHLPLTVALALLKQIDGKARFGKFLRREGGLRVLKGYPGGGVGSLFQLRSREDAIMIQLTTRGHGEGETVPLFVVLQQILIVAAENDGDGLDVGEALGPFFHYSAT